MCALPCLALLIGVNPIFYSDAAPPRLSLPRLILRNFMGSTKAVPHFVPWDGTLSLGEFVTSANILIQKWNALEHELPSWSWVPSTTPLASSSQVEGYLSMEKHCIFGSYEEEELGDEVHCYDFHIVYSCSYRVPTLFFRGYHSDGQQLVMNEIEKDLPLSSAKVVKESKWTFITQKEHPYLKRPWFALHPCGTNELMRLLLETPTVPSSPFDSDENRIQGYLISWLSVVAQVVGLKVPLQIADTGSLRLS